MTIGKRLRLAIESSGMSVTEFSKYTDIPYPTLQQYLSDKRSPATEALTKICIQTNINLHWLLVGQDPMLRDGQAANKEEPLTKRHEALLSMFDSLNEDQKREILSSAQEKERLNKMEELLGEVLKKVG